MSLLLNSNLPLHPLSVIGMPSLEWGCAYRKSARSVVSSSESFLLVWFPAASLIPQMSLQPSRLLCFMPHITWIHMPFVLFFTKPAGGGRNCVYGLDCLAIPGNRLGVLYD